MNLKEAHSLFKADGNPNIGFSTFAKLRPQQCILAGPKGTHTVCVCIYHYNVKLQLSAIGIKNQSLSLLRKLISWYLVGTFASDALDEQSSG